MHPCVCTLFLIFQDRVASLSKVQRLTADYFGSGKFLTSAPRELYTGYLGISKLQCPQVRRNASKVKSNDYYTTHRDPQIP
jgi:hypothetical protein